MTEHTRVLETARATRPVQLALIQNLSERAKEVYDQTARRAFELYESRGRQEGYDLEDWLHAESEILCSIPIRCFMKSKSVLAINAVIPDFIAGDLKVWIQPLRLTISQTGESKNGAESESKRPPVQIFRIVDLPVEVDGAKATATFQNGILRLEIPAASRIQNVRTVPKAA
jgi:HSP20 family molecular chaperone IbpA